MDWDNFYIGLARYVSTKSKDPSTQTGAVIVRPDNTVASVGFNGFPQAMPDVSAWYENREEKYSRVIHAEMNSLLLCREPVRGYTLYSSLFPCDRCAVHAIQAGIERFVFPRPPEDKKDRWGESWNRTIRYFLDCGIDWKEISDFA